MDIMVATEIRLNFLWHNDNNRVYIQPDCKHNLHACHNAPGTTSNIIINWLHWRNRNTNQIPATRKDGSHFVCRNTQHANNNIIRLIHRGLIPDSKIRPTNPVLFINDGLKHIWHIHHHPNRVITVLSLSAWITVCKHLCKIPSRTRIKHPNLENHLQYAIWFCCSVDTWLHSGLWRHKNTDIYS